MYKNIIQVNIGMENNPFCEKTIVGYIDSYLATRIMAYKFVTGEYLGNPERTCVIMLETSLPLSSVKTLFRHIANELTQDVIAFTFNGTGFIVYNSDYKGAEIEFSDEIFQTIGLEIINNKLIPINHVNNNQSKERFA